MDLFKSGTRRMLRDIESELRFTRGLIGEDALDARVMAAMARVRAALGMGVEPIPAGAWTV